LRECDYYDDFDGFNYITRNAPSKKYFTPLQLKNITAPFRGAPGKRAIQSQQAAGSQEPGGGKYRAERDREDTTHVKQKKSWLP